MNPARALALALSGGIALVALSSLAHRGAEESAPPEAARKPVGSASPPNPAPYVPPQCWARTKDELGVHDPCFTCHQRSRAPNYVDDGELQTAISMPAPARANRWSNTLVMARPIAWDDERILAWVRTKNYRLRRGLRFDFDGEGFDRAPDGSLTGWRAYAYQPMPGMFWPTNGSAGDAFIRLPAAYREDEAGQPNQEVYRLNFAILEAYVTRRDVPLWDVDERAHEVGEDLDGDGRLGIATRVRFVWPPHPGRELHWVGRAASLDRATDGWPAAGLFPRGTEILHTLRYLDVQSGRVVAAARMKEIRYMEKVRWRTYSDLELEAANEAREAIQNPERLEKVRGDATVGVGTGRGWRILADIEDSAGELRPQTYEELSFCVGCHGGVGATVDGTFSFARKLGADTPAAGWYQQGTIDRPLPDRRRADGTGEYALYLTQVGGGDDFRSNDEVAARFFLPDHRPDPAKLAGLAFDVRPLIVPSPPRALALDRAYLAHVRDQSFALGREVLVGAPARVERELVEGASTGVEAGVTPEWEGSGAH